MSQADELGELFAARPFRGLTYGSGWYVVTRGEDGIDQVRDGPFETADEARDAIFDRPPRDDEDDGEWLARYLKLD